MDPPDLFEGLDDDSVTSMPQEPRSRRRPSPTTGGLPPRPGMPSLPARKDQSVNLDLDPVMYPALEVAKRRGNIVTSGSEGFPADGVHAPTSQHYKGTAIDVRYAGNRAVQARAYAEQGYVVIQERTHLHVQKYRA